MANYTLIDRPSELLTGAADVRLRLLLADLASSTIQSQADLLSAVSSAFTDFYGRLGQPLAGPMVFAGIPIAEEWNAYQDTLAGDLEILYTQVSQIGAASDRALAFAAVENRMLQEAADALTNQVNAFNARKPTRLGLQQWVISDGFQDKSKVELSLTTALVLNQVVELAHTGETDVTSKIKLFVDDSYVNAALFGSQALVDIGPGSSNGFIGNLHEANVPENTNTTMASGQLVSYTNAPGTTIGFVGDQGLHADVHALVDGDPSTWFEYEVCNFPDTLKYNPALGYGLSIDVPTLGSTSGTSVPWCAFHSNTDVPPVVSFFPPAPSTWTANPSSTEIDANGNYVTSAVNRAVDPTTGQLTSVVGASGQPVGLSGSGAAQNGGVLRLALAGVFDSPQTINQVSILFNTLNNKPATVVSVEVRDETSGTWVAGIPLSTPIDVTLSDATTPALSDTPEIWTIPETLVKFVRITIEQTQSYTAKLGHVLWLQQNSLDQTADPSLLNPMLGTTGYDASVPSPSLSRIDGPNISLENILSHQNGVLSTLSASTPINSSVIGPVVEVFDGWRYAIAIRDISFSALTYVPTGLLVTKDFSVPIDIKRIWLDTREQVPVGVDTTDWLTYEISLDSGVSWLGIAPRSHYGSQDPRSYVVNSTGVAGAGIQTPNYDPQKNPANHIRMRVTLKTGINSSLSPRLESYSLILEGNTL